MTKKIIMLTLYNQDELKRSTADGLVGWRVAREVLRRPDMAVFIVETKVKI
jgi:hypothetical protein